MRFHVIEFVGASGSGKTTLVIRLIRFFIERGESVGVMKHTHHTITHPFRGDSQRFLDAGAAPVALVSPVITFFFPSPTDVERLPLEEPAKLAGRFDTDWVLVEGFKSIGDWPRVLVERSGVATPELDRTHIAARITDRQERGDGDFGADEMERLAAFLDRITT
jgi:molybdopterin-guanine dinucleotide biosynthesis protein MobB